MTPWLAKFERVTTKSGRYIPELDGLRCVAILAVIVFHISAYVVNKMPAVGTLAEHEQIKHFTFLGNFGVELFFVISGFILSQPFLRNKGRLPGQRIRNYYLRRLTRLEPPYLIAMVAIYLSLFAKQGYSTGMHLLPNFLASIAYVHNVVLGEKSLVNPVAWSLEIEIQFYLSMPLMLALLGSAWNGRRWILGVVAAVFAIVNCLWAPQIITLPNFLQYFVAGILWADIYSELQSSKLYNSLLADGIAIVTVAAWFVAYNYASVPMFSLATSVAISVFFGAALCGRYSLRVLRADYVRIPGAMCYSLYLLHYMLMPLFGPWTLRVGLRLTDALLPLVIVEMIMIGGAVLVCSAIFYRAVERPCMYPDWPSKLRNYVAGRTVRLSVSNEA